MKTGTKSILFGVHQFFWHPFTVWLAWIVLYRRLPTWKECICILVHDWGYWGKPNMDGKEGERHPETGARIVGWLFGAYHHDLCLYHSRYYAKSAGKDPSKLCWADKLSIRFEPWWLYLPRAWASDELREYRQICADGGHIPLDASNRRWFDFVRSRLINQGLKREGVVTTATNPSCAQGS